MRYNRVHFAGACVFERLGSQSERFSGIDHVIDENRHAPRHVSNKDLHLRLSLILRFTVSCGISVEPCVTASCTATAARAASSRACGRRVEMLRVLVVVVRVVMMLRRRSMSTTTSARDTMPIGIGKEPLSVFVGLHAVGHFKKLLFPHHRRNLLSSDTEALQRFVARKPACWTLCNAARARTSLLLRSSLDVRSRRLRFRMRRRRVQSDAVRQRRLRTAAKVTQARSCAERLT